MTAISYYEYDEERSHKKNSIHCCRDERLKDYFKKLCLNVNADISLPLLQIFHGDIINFNFVIKDKCTIQIIWFLTFVDIRGSSNKF